MTALRCAACEQRIGFTPDPRKAEGHVYCTNPICPHLPIEHVWTMEVRDDVIRSLWATGAEAPYLATRFAVTNQRIYQILQQRDPQLKARARRR